MVNRVFASRFDYWLARGDVGAAKITTDPCGRFFLCFPILSQVRNLGGANLPYFVNLRTTLTYKIYTRSISNVFVKFKKHIRCINIGVLNKIICFHVLF